MLVFLLLGCVLVVSLFTIVFTAVVCGLGVAVVLWDLLAGCGGWVCLCSVWFGN